MKLLPTFFTLTLLFLLAGCSKKPISKIDWQSQELTAGEFSNSWQAELQYNSKSHMLYGVTNDKQNLYVSLRVTDPAVKRKIMFTGLTFWINTSVKSSEQLELTFPIEQSKQTSRNKMIELTSRQSTDINKSEIIKFNEKYTNGLSEISIIGFDGETESKLLGNKSKNGINAILMTDSLHTLFYEVQIPLDMIFENPSGFLLDSSKSFSYGFETGYIRMQSKSNGGESGGMGGRGGGKGGGKKGGGHGQASGADSQKMAVMSEMSQPSKFTVKNVSLSNK